MTAPHAPERRAHPAPHERQHLAVTRAALAAAILDLTTLPPFPPDVGPVTLHPHQQFAAARLRRALTTHGGALLADAVGLGKTWVALALVRDAQRHDPTPALVVAPAALRQMWRDAAAQANAPIVFRSTESLSTSAPPSTPDRPALVVVDEAHHFRTPRTQRRERLTTLCARTPILLLSATPVHNASRDLGALLALFLGDRAHRLDAASLAYLVVRRGHAHLRPPTRSPAAPHQRHSAPATEAPATETTLRIPRVALTRWHQLPAADAVRRALLALPPPVPAADGTPAPALSTLTLVRFWTSSDAALRAALRRRLARAAALAHALARGRHPDRGTLARWVTHDDALQLPLFVDGGTPADAPALAAHVDAHAHAVRQALATLDAAPPADPARAAWLRGICAQHPGAKVVAFTQFADTARALYRALARDGHVGLLTAAGGRIASGPIPRAALLARFAPLAAAAHPPPAAERVDLLLATDCLAEGLDLRDANIVVHLDLPWTPARLAQRVGRAARLGGPHPVVHVHALRPDPATARWLRLARRLRAKVRAARHALGARPHAARGAPARRADLAEWTAVHRRCERWLAAAPAAGTARAPVAAVRCGRAGFVAVCAPGHPTAAAAAGTPGALGSPPGAPPPTPVVAVGARGPTAAPRAVARALHRLGRPGATAVPPPAALVHAARRAVHAWARRRAAAAAVGLPAAAPHPPDARRPTHAGAVVRAATTRADAALRAAPPHTRGRRAAAVAALRGALARPVSEGAERALAAAARLTDDEAWLAAARAAVAGDAAAPPAAPPAAAPPAVRIDALVLLLP